MPGNRLILELAALKASYEPENLCLLNRLRTFPQQINSIVRLPHLRWHGCIFTEMKIFYKVGE